MSGRGDARRFGALDLGLGLVFALGLANFGWHAIQGDYGVFALIQIEADAAALDSELAELRAERARLERLTAGLSTARLDLDLLDERARGPRAYARG